MDGRDCGCGRGWERSQGRERSFSRERVYDLDRGRARDLERAGDRRYADEDRQARGRSHPWMDDRLSPPRHQTAVRMAAIEYPGNPSMRPPIARKMVLMTQEMEKREDLLAANALVVTEASPLGLGSKDELKDVIFHHFGIRKHEFNVFFVAILNLFWCCSLRVRIGIWFLLRVVS